MPTQISTIELSSELVNMAYEVSLNVSETCKNALKEAIRRLQGFIPENTSVLNTVFILMLLILFSVELIS